MRWFAINPERWRADLLALLIKASLLLSALVYLPNLYEALTTSDLPVAVIDTLVVTAVFALFYLRLPFLFRAAAFCAAAYLFGAWLLLSTGLPSEVYLLGFSILATLLLGLRVGLFSVVLNAVTLVAGPYLGAVADNAAGFPGWPVSALDFILIDTFLTLAIGAVLAVVEGAVQREQVEATLRNTERRFRALIEHSSDSIALIDANSKIIYLSPAVAAIEGYEPEELIGRNGLENTHPDDLPLAAKTIADLMAHPGEPFPVLARRRHKKGHWIWLEGVATNLLDDPAVGAIVSNCRDVTERLTADRILRESEERLRLSERHLRTVIETTPECVTLMSPEGKILETNAAGLAMKEADSREQLIGLGFDAVVAPEDLPRVRLFHEGVCKGQGGRLTYDLVGLRGTRRTVETISAALNGADGRLQHLAISRDVTQTRRLEEQLRQAQKMEAIGQLAGGIAHDFNNLLTIVIGYCDILGEKKLLPPPEQELLDEVRKSGERAAALTRQLLAFSRKQVLEPRVLSLNAIVADMDRMLRRLIGEDVVLTSSLEPSLWPVKVDAGQIEQVIVNLAVNARDAMPSGGRLIIETANVELDAAECRAHPNRPPGRYAAVAMTDTGDGMTPEVMARIFEPFFTTKGPGRGTGLGLSVVHGIVEQSGGFLDVKSEVSEGTAFTVYLPVADGLVEYSAAPQRAEAKVQGSETLLLVEDQDELRKLLRRTLEGHGYKVLEAVNGQVALTVARAHSGKIDAVVTDVVMPTMGGRELVEKLRVRQADIRVLYISGHTDDAVVRHGVIDASHAFLQKPFAPAAFVSKVHDLFAQHAPRKHLLFVDDEAPLVYLATRTLEERGYRVSGCGSGTDALAAFKRDPNAFDLVITDLTMRGMSGLELARALKQLRPELPVILASGFIDEELRGKAAAAGVNELLYKPGTIEEFSDLVDRAAKKLQ